MELRHCVASVDRDLLGEIVSASSETSDNCNSDHHQHALSPCSFVSGKGTYCTVVSSRLAFAGRLYMIV